MYIVLLGQRLGNAFAMLAQFSYLSCFCMPGAEVQQFGFSAARN
jgi:hypothetical protein